MSQVRIVVHFDPTDVHGTFNTCACNTAFRLKLVKNMGESSIIYFQSIQHLCFDAAVAQVTKCFGNHEKIILTFKLMVKIPGSCFGLLIGRFFRRYFATFRNKNNAFLRCRCFYRLFLIFCLDGFMGRKEGQKLESYISVVVEIILELFIGHSGTILYQ